MNKKLLEGLNDFYNRYEGSDLKRGATVSVSKKKKLNESIKDNLRAASEGRRGSEQSIINEIANYFIDTFNSEEYLNALEKDCINEINKGKKVKTFYLEFWGGWEGGSDAHFLVGYPAIKWQKGEGYVKGKYKGIELYEINFDVMEKVEQALIDLLKREGFSIINTKNGRSNPNLSDWYKKEITVSLTDFLDESIKKDRINKAQSEIDKLLRRK